MKVCKAKGTPMKVCKAKGTPGASWQGNQDRALFLYQLERFIICLSVFFIIILLFCLHFIYYFDYYR